MTKKMSWQKSVEMSLTSKAKIHSRWLSCLPHMWPPHIDDVMSIRLKHWPPQSDVMSNRLKQWPPQTDDVMSIRWKHWPPQIDVMSIRLKTGLHRLMSCQSGWNTGLHTLMMSCQSSWKTGLHTLSQSTIHRSLWSTSDPAILRQKAPTKSKTWHKRNLLSHSVKGGVQ